MINNTLYFPYIRVPHNDWFTRTLLYWDEVGSIVPYNYKRKPEKLGRYMQSLVGEGLVRPVIPGEHINRIPKFEDAFLEEAERYRNELNTDSDSLQNMPKTKIHIEKMGKLGKELCKMDLAKKGEYPWYDVETHLADKFMAYLAGVLGNLKQINSRPITDNLKNIKVFESPESTRSLILEDLLPAPEEDVSASDIAAFKAKNQNYLLRFRNEIESFLISVNSIENDETREEMIQRFLESSKDTINQLIDNMKSNGWTKISCGRFITYTITGLTLADAIISGGLFSTIAAAFGVAGSAYQTYQEHKQSYTPLNSNFAYAALAREI